jgi:uncharacterized membrane protein
MMFFIAAVAGAVFGGADQYVGSLSAIPWLVDSSLLSAPWLLLPFLFGCSQRSPRRAVVMGCVVTAFALVGYFVMTLSPVEGVHLHGTLAPILALVRSEKTVIIGGVITAALYGFLGFTWRTTKSWICAVLVGGAFCLEPLASALVGRLPQQSVVWVLEIAVGVILTAYLLGSRVLHGTSTSRT